MCGNRLWTECTVCTHGGAGTRVRIMHTGVSPQCAHVGVIDTGLRMFTHHGTGVPAGGELCTYADSGGPGLGRLREYALGLGNSACGSAPVRCVFLPRARAIAAGGGGAWGAFTARWHSSGAGYAEWPPGSAYQHGSQRGRSRSSGSAAPAARTPAATASVSPAGPPAGSAAASGAPGPTGSRSGPGLGLDGCPATLQRGTDSLSTGQLPGGPQSLFGPHPREPCRPKPSRILTAHDPPGKQGTEKAVCLVWTPHWVHMKTLELSP